MTIILLSTWFGQKGASNFAKLIAPLGATPKVAIIHNALRFKAWRTVHNALLGLLFVKLGCKPIFIDLTEEKQLERLCQCDIVYLGCGNARRFKRILRETTSAGEVIVQHIRERDGILIGASAGAIVCGADIRTGDMLGDSQAVWVCSNTGMNLLTGNACFLPHYKKRYDENIEQQRSKGFTNHIWRLKNGESLFVKDGSVDRYS